jgi:putative nucleotidyltransferase with HDIG domain
MDRSLQDIIAVTGELPALPSTTARLLRLLDDDTVGVGAVLDVIGHDPALTANLLKLCNSAYYGLRRQVGTVQEALVMLGNRAVVSLAFATSLGDVLRGPLAGYRLERDALWRHSLAVAVGAAHLVEAGGARALRERAFTAGLVHDIGKLILNAPLKAKLRQLPQTGGFDVLVLGERAILGFDHAEAGAALAAAWNFPTALAGVIGAHHDLARAANRTTGDGGPEDPDQAGLLKAVAAADLTANRAGCGAGTPGGDDAHWRAELAALGIDSDEATAVLDRLPGDVTALSDVLGGRP